MARTPAPWWRSSHQCYYAKVGGKQLRLDPELSRAIEVLRRHLAGTPSPAPGMTVADLARRYLADAAVRVRPTTLEVYRWGIGRFVASFGERDAAGIKAIDIHGWAKSQKWGQTSIRNYSCVVRDMFRWASDQELLPYGLGRLKLPRGKRRVPITEEDAQRFRAAITSPHLLAWWDVASACGARPGELSGLDARHVAADRRSATVSGKTGERTIWFPDHVTALLDALCENRQTGPILLGPRGQEWNRASLAWNFRAVSKRANVHVVPYHTRGLFAMRAIRAGVDALTLAKLLGHASPTMTMSFYASWSDDTLMAAVDRAG